MASSRQSINQVQTLKQQQTLSPQQLQLMRLLSLNTLELEEDVSRTLAENPALEASDFPGENVSTADADSLPPSAYERSDALIAEAAAYARAGSAADPDDRHREAPDNVSGTTVMEYIESQLAELPFTERQRLIAHTIAGNIDDNGYLTLTPRQIADDLTINDGLDTTTAEVNKVLDQMRRLDPPGICAVDLRDCLLLQLRRRELTDSSPAVATAREMVADYFDLFSKRHFDSLCTALDVNREQLRRAIDIVKTLNPKPGAMISGSSVDDTINQITPDFIIEVDNNNIELVMPNTIPALRVESSFNIDDAALPPRRRGAEDTLAFVRSRRDDALAYIRAIDLRRQTLYRIMRAIISLQRDFFLSEGDPSTLKPMILKDVAAITGDDISVISRATAGKYLSTRHGTYPLKFFFNEAPTAESGDSSIKIIETLRALIAAEDPSDPLSDETLTAMLNERGYAIARRTVAKYREKASIPVARLRRQLT